jgi:hypothetical protein
MSLVQEKLDKLGQMDPNEIAGFFKCEGVKGYRMIESCCPVANYLDSDGEYSVYNTSVESVNGSYDLPDSVMTFVVDFDNGWYPELEED